MANFMSDMISNLGDVLYYLALISYVSKLDKSNMDIAISIITISEMLPTFIAFITGSIADKTKNKINGILLTLIIRTILYILIAFVMGFKPELWIVIFVSFINFVSDIIGLYENGMHSYVSKYLVNDEDRESAMAFSASASETLDIVFQTIGAILITIVSYRILALINAGTFIFSAIIILIIKSDLLKILPKTKEDISEEEENLSLKEMFYELIDSIKYLTSLDEIRSTIISLPIVNGITSIIQMLIVLIMAENPKMIIISTEFTISILLLLITIGSILGGFFTINLFKNLKIKILMSILALISVITLVSILIGNIYLTLVSIFLSSLIEGVLNPKMGSVIMNNIPEGKIGTIMGGMVTYFSLGDFVSSTLFSILVIIISAQNILILYLLVSTATFIYTIFNKKNIKI